MSRRNRLGGHTLAFEGAPHDDQRRRIGWMGVAGLGRALCSCGEMSPEFPSGARRRLWHKDHKNDIRVERYVASDPPILRRTATPSGTSEGRGESDG